MNSISFALGAVHSLVLLVSLLEAVGFKRSGALSTKTALACIHTYIHTQFNIGGYATPRECPGNYYKFLCEGGREREGESERETKGERGGRERNREG